MSCLQAITTVCRISEKQHQDMVVSVINIRFVNLTIESCFALGYLAPTMYREVNELEPTGNKQMNTEYKSVGEIDVYGININDDKVDCQENM